MIYLITVVALSKAQAGLKAAQQQDPAITVERVREYIVQTYGRENLDTINLLFILDLSVILLAALLVVIAARGWARIRSSRRMARRAWYVWLLLPICMAIIPWTSSVKDTRGSHPISVRALVESPSSVSTSDGRK